MQDPNMKPPEGAPQEQPQGEGDPSKALMAMKDGLSSLMEVAPKAFPPEAQKLLQTAASSFDGFLSIVLGGKGDQAPAQAPAQAPQGEMAAGNPRAVPA